VPLAEEYRKEGMLDEAIGVLQKGLERQPGYMSARVSLGKIYLEKGQMDEARIEFESVIKLIPDNLYAHKRLAEIYRDTGKRDLAIDAFRTLLKLNPVDVDALNNLGELEGTYTEQLAERTEDHAQISEKAVAAEEEIPFKEMNFEYASPEQTQGETAASREKIDAFKESLFGFTSEAGKESPEETDAVKEEGTEESPEESCEEWFFEEVESIPASETAEEESIEIEETPEEEEEALSFGDMADVLKTEGLETVEEAEPMPEEMFRAAVPSEADRMSPTDDSELFQTADRFILEEKYLGAINVYQEILAETPDDKKTLQRIEELRSLLKLMGKDKEIMLSKLNAFLSAVKKRGDEFFRRS
jgi:tetratricopeptide (TPR) repeat protein